MDSEVDGLLGLDQKKEATIALTIVKAGFSEGFPRMHKPIPSLALEVNRLSKEEVDYPIIWETNEASQLKTKSETDSWKRSLGHSNEQFHPLRQPFPCGSRRKTCLHA